MTTRVLISGGAGFVGSHLIRACINQGWQVGVLYLPEAGLDQIVQFLPQINTFAVDQTTESVFSAVEKFKPDVVIHLASIFLAKHTSADIQRLIQSNITYGTQILDAMANFGVRYLVNTGTSWQHYESEPYNPVNLYAATKQAFEDIVDFYIQSGKMEAVTLKLFDTYGVGDPRPKLFNLLEKTIREGSRLEMSPGEQLIDIVHVDDVARAYVLAAKRLLTEQVDGHEKYAISSGNPLRLRDLAGMFEKISGKPLNIVWGGREYREREVMVPWNNGPSLPGWSPEITLEDGIRSILQP